jgi:hypothetical protein
MKKVDILDEEDKTMKKDLLKPVIVLDREI